VVAVDDRSERVFREVVEDQNQAAGPSRRRGEPDVAERRGRDTTRARGQQRARSGRVGQSGGRARAFCG